MKYQIVLDLNRDVERMAEGGVRQRYPDASDREVFLLVQPAAPPVEFQSDLCRSATAGTQQIEGW
ncbi:MAG: hypothetical protein H6512_13260 [Acidimicrobiia bacterium]|nr:hypothetical protein [Acidimicrobiia bacterium]